MIEIILLISAVLFIFALKLFGRPSTAHRANLFAMLAMALAVFSAFNFDFSKIKLDPNKIFQFMKSDKKNQNSQINLVLLKSFGEPELYEEGNPFELQEFIGDFVEDFRS